ncbi:DMT family transporter [Galactobacillus timonensis]|uniref:DMT family transporter n=1 Tax=Galactobacillus timonensis TaxID=2041840 RepID=UPI0023F316D7|nr:DMT family transporter [Galactobacillus timonensis]MCI6755065.1 DMT family transporter [Galactobacillus timonensis]
MNTKSRYYLSAVAAIFFWGSSFVATKLAYASFGPLTVCFLRFALSLLILKLVRIIRKDNKKLEKQDVPVLLTTGLLGISVYYACENYALTLTSASAASLISGAYPAITALIGALVYHVHVTKKQAAGIALAMAGIVILTSGGSFSGSNVRLGNAILIFDGFLWAFYNFLIPHIRPAYSVLSITYYQTLLALPFLIPGLFLEGHASMTITPSAIWALLYLAVGCSVLAYLLYNFSLRGISPSAAAAIMNLMPVFGLLLSAIILNESITPASAAGGVIVILGVLLSAK